MPNIRDFMNKNNITSSSRDSQQLRRQVPVGQQRYDQNRFPSQFGSPVPQFPNNQYYVSPGSLATNKYTRSKGECVEQLSRLLQELDRKEIEMKKISEGHNGNLMKKFSSDYDNLSQQIVRTVETHLSQNKERILQEIRERRNIQYAEVKPIKRNIDKIRSQVVTLRQGLHRQNQYRHYISRIVLKDFEQDMSRLQQDIQRLRFPNVDLSLDEKYYSCFRNDLSKVIVVRDELHSRMNDNFSYSPQSFMNQPKMDQFNSHINRDQIKRTQQSRVV